MLMACQLLAICPATNTVQFKPQNSGFKMGHCLWH